MDIKVVDTTGEEIKQEVTEIETPPEIEQDGVMLREQVAKGLFDFNPSEMASYKNKIDNLIEYAKLQTDDHSVASIKQQIRHLGFKLGSPPLGEKLINYLNVYVKLYLQGKRIEAQKKEFERGENESN